MWIVIVLLILFFAAGYILGNRKSAEDQPDSKEKDEIAVLKAQLEEQEKIFEKLNPVVDRFLILRDGITNAAEKTTAKERLETLHNLLISAKVWSKNITEKQGLDDLGMVFDDAEKLTDDAERFMPIVKLLQGKIRKFYAQLRTIELDMEGERRIRTDYLTLSLMIVDALESIDNPNYIENHQGVNVKLLKGEIDVDEAVKNTSPITYLDIETSQWAQKLCRSLDKWANSSDKAPLIDDRPYFLNGYRFEFNKKQ